MSDLNSIQSTISRTVPEPFAPSFADTQNLGFKSLTGSISNCRSPSETPTSTQGFDVRSLTIDPPVITDSSRLHIEPGVLLPRGDNPVALTTEGEMGANEQKQSEPKTWRDLNHPYIGMFVLGGLMATPWVGTMVRQRLEAQARQRQTTPIGSRHQ
jgi:hypothetical protein